MAGIEERITLKTWVRWLLVLPAAVGAFLGIQLVMVIVLWVEPNRWAQLLNSLAGPFCFVYAGARVAPDKPTVVAVVLAVICATFYAVVVTKALVTHSYEPMGWLVLTSIVSVVAAIVACIQIHQADSKLNKV